MSAIIKAAEATADQIESEAEGRMRERLAEGVRAANYRIQAAEDEAREILETARQEAARLHLEASTVRNEAASKALTVVAEAESMAERIVGEATQAGEAARGEAERRALDLLTDARDTADGVRSEGLELVSNLREMGNALRSNADRILQDIRRIHTQMVEQIDLAERDADARSGQAGTDAGTGAAPGTGVSRQRSSGRDLGTAPQGEILDVPEFMPDGR